MKIPFFAPTCATGMRRGGGRAPFFDDVDGFFGSGWGDEDWFFGGRGPSADKCSGQACRCGPFALAHPFWEDQWTHWNPLFRWVSHDHPKQICAESEEEDKENTKEKDDKKQLKPKTDHRQCVLRSNDRHGELVPFIRGFGAMKTSTADDKWTVELACPGARKEDIEVFMKDNRLLTVRGRRKQVHMSSSGSEKQKTQAQDGTKEANPPNSQFRSLSYGSFERQFTLPKDVDPASIDCHFDSETSMLKIAFNRRSTPEVSEDVGAVTQEQETLKRFGERVSISSSALDQLQN